MPGSRTQKRPTQCMPGKIPAGRYEVLRGNGVPGGALGSDDAKQCVFRWPMSRKPDLQQADLYANGLKVPTNIDELLEDGQSRQSGIMADTASACVARGLGDDRSGLLVGLMPTLTKRT